MANKKCDKIDELKIKVLNLIKKSRLPNRDKRRALYRAETFLLDKPVKSS